MLGNVVKRGPALGVVRKDHVNIDIVVEEEAHLLLVIFRNQFYQLFVIPELVDVLLFLVLLDDLTTDLALCRVPIARNSMSRNIRSLNSQLAIGTHDRL